MTFEIPETLWTILFIALLCSVIQAALMQKLKELPVVTKGAVTWIVNLAFSLALGIAFAMYFFGLDLYAGLWVGFICFLGASAIYEGIIKTKKQISEPIKANGTINVDPIVVKTQDEEIK